MKKDVITLEKITTIWVECKQETKGIRSIQYVLFSGSICRFDERLSSLSFRHMP